MGFLTATVIKWQSLRYTQGLISDKEATAGRDIVLNGNRISDIEAIGSDTKFYYTDNPANPRDGRIYVEVADHYTVVRDALHSDYPHEYTTLFVYKNNDPTLNYSTLIIPTANIAWMHSFHGHNNFNTNISWVTYVDGKGSLQTVLATGSLENLSGNYFYYDFDGNRYKSVLVGTQRWMIQNLRTTHYANGTDIQLIIDDAPWLADTLGAYCWYNNDEGNNKEVSGALYNWHAINNANTLVYFERMGVQSVGWRVPTRADWDTLIAALGYTDPTGGGPMKEIGWKHWNFDNAGATDLVGLRIRGNGNRYVDTEDPAVHGYTNLTVYSDMWTSEQADVDDAYSTYQGSHFDDFEDWSHEKYGGMAIRCVRDI